MDCSPMQIKKRIQNSTDMLATTLPKGKKIFVKELLDGSKLARIFGERQDSSYKCSQKYFPKIRLGCLHLSGVLVSWRIPAPQSRAHYFPLLLKIRHIMLTQLHLPQQGTKRAILSRLQSQRIETCRLLERVRLNSDSRTAGFIGTVQDEFDMHVGCRVIVMNCNTREVTVGAY